MSEPEEPTPADRAIELLETLSQMLPSPESVAQGEPLPDWLLQPWAARLGDIDDPNLPEVISEAEKWLSNH